MISKFLNRALDSFADRVARRIAQSTPLAVSAPAPDPKAKVQPLAADTKAPRAIRVSKPKPRRSETAPKSKPRRAANDSAPSQPQEMPSAPHLTKRPPRFVTDKGNIVSFCQDDSTRKQWNAGENIRPRHGSKVQRFTKEKLIWAKQTSTKFVNFRHLANAEDILVFSHGTMTKTGSTKGKNARTFNPQGATIAKKVGRACATHLNSTPTPSREYEGMENMPREILYFDKVKSPLHPFAKPVDLLKYLILTYSNEGDLVVDPTMGSGSAGVACVNTGRRFVGCERDASIFKGAEGRILDGITSSEMREAA